MSPSKKSGMSSRFTLGSEEMKHRTIAAISGEIGAGKTYFAFTAPGPNLLQNIDQGTEGVIEQFRKEGKEIYDQYYAWNPGECKDDAEKQEAAIEIRDKWEADYYYAIDNGVRSVTWDTESRIWQCHRYAEFGAPNADNVKDYDTLNQRFEAMINAAKARDINLLMIRSMKDKWGLVGTVSVKTGKKGFGKAGREIWGYEHLAGVAFTELHFFYNKEDKDYYIEVGKCRHNKTLQFTTVPRCSFAELGTLMVDGSTEEQWS